MDAKLRAEMERLADEHDELKSKDACGDPDYYGFVDSFKSGFQAAIPLAQAGLKEELSIMDQALAKQSEELAEALEKIAELNFLIRYVRLYIGPERWKHLFGSNSRLDMALLPTEDLQKLYKRIKEEFERRGLP